MQSNHYLVTIKTVYYRYLPFLKYPLAAICGCYIYFQIRDVSFDFHSVEQKPFAVILILVFSFMFLNWLLEAKRWQVSVAFESITLIESLQAVLGGLSLNWVLPFTLGDVGGRLANRTRKTMSLIAIGVNRIIILTITLCYGSISLVFFIGSNYWWLLVAVILTVFLISVISLKTDILGKSASFLRLPLLFHISLLTLFRYSIFTFQFYLLLSFFNPDLSTVVILMGIGWVFLFRTIIPSILGGIGVREASAMVFFEPYVQEIQLILMPCLLIWFINSIVPSIVGLAFILRYSSKH